MDAASLGYVVGRLLLWVIGDMAGHGRRNDEGTRLALAEMQSDSPSAIKSAREVGIDDLIPRLDGRIQDTVVSGTPRVCDEDVHLPKITHDVVDELLDVGVVPHVALVRFGLDAVFVREFLGVALAAGGAGGVGDCDVGTHFGAAAGGFGADACGAGGPSYDDDFALEAEKVFEGIGFGDFDGHGEDICN